MARICYRCKAYDAEGTQQTCPTCQVPMQFTLLPPQEGPVTAMTMPEITPQRAGRRPGSTTGSSSTLQLLGLAIRFRWFAGLVVIPLLVVGGFFGLDLSTRPSLKSRYDQI